MSQKGRGKLREQDIRSKTWKHTEDRRWFCWCTFINAYDEHYIHATTARVYFSGVFARRVLLEYLIEWRKPAQAQKFQFFSVGKCAKHAQAQKFQAFLVGKRTNLLRLRKFMFFNSFLGILHMRHYSQKMKFLSLCRCRALSHWKELKFLSQCKFSALWLYVRSGRHRKK